jgi:hypothetical protein
MKEIVEARNTEIEDELGLLEGNDDNNNLMNKKSCDKSNMIITTPSTIDQKDSDGSMLTINNFLKASPKTINSKTTKTLNFIKFWGEVQRVTEPMEKIGYIYLRKIALYT